MPFVSRPLIDRLTEKIDTSDPSGCWLWTASLRDGYGQIQTTKGSVRSAHLVIWELVVGPVAPGLELDHLCRVRRCVNPAHLEPVTHIENLLRSPIVLSTMNLEKTHCPRGHELDGAGLVNGRPRRFCETCQTTHRDRWRERASAQIEELAATA